MKRLHISPKIIEWAGRYLPAEIAGTITALIGAMLAHTLSGSLATAAIMGALSENIGFYGYIAVRDGVRQYARTAGPTSRRLTSTVSVTARNLMVEFGAAEALDSLLLRPFFMYLVPQLIHNFTAGIFLGKLCADLGFYGLAILGYELRKRLFNASPDLQTEQKAPTDEATS